MMILYIFKIKYRNNNMNYNNEMHIIIQFHFERKNLFIIE